jgi:acyl-CoA reductase-like NAD-dependent aldehyde dehydrogenase
MSPKRVFVHQRRYDELIDALRTRLSAAGRIEADTARLEQAMQLIDEAEHQGATLLTPRPAGSAWHPAVVGKAQPSMAVMQQPASLPMLAIAYHDDDHQASELVNQCPYGLGATIFTASRQRAEALANHIDVGSILINDMIVPTADPRLPFEPRRQSGHGVTRGNEGLLAMTRAKAIIHSRGRRRPYWRRLDNSDTPTVADAIQLLHHRRWLTRIRALRHMLTRTSKTDR